MLNHGIFSIMLALLVCGADACSEAGPRRQDRSNSDAEKRTVHWSRRSPPIRVCKVHANAKVDCVPIRSVVKMPVKYEGLAVAYYVGLDTLIERLHLEGLDLSNTTLFECGTDEWGVLRAKTEADFGGENESAPSAYTKRMLAACSAATAARL